MAVQTKAAIERRLTISAKRVRFIREVAEKLKDTLAVEEREAIPTTPSLIKPSLSPSGK